MNNDPFCWVIREHGWDSTSYEIFPDFESMLNWAKKNISAKRAQTCDFFSLTQDRKEVKIDISQFYSKKVENVVVVEEEREDQEVFSWK